MKTILVRSFEFASFIIFGFSNQSLARPAFNWNSKAINRAITRDIKTSPNCNIFFYPLKGPPANKANYKYPAAHGPETLTILLLIIHSNAS